MRPIRGVLFDLDGVLVDSEPLYSEATAGVVADFGHTFSWELKTRMMGTDARAGGGIIIEALQLPLSVEEYLSRRNARLVKLFANTPAIAGAAALVSHLRSLRIPIAIATSSAGHLCDHKWAQHSWIRDIPVKVCGDDPSIAALKPAPDIYLEASRRLGLPAADCLVFEDSPAGVAAGVAAGAQVIALKAPRLDPELVAAADRVISSYAELDLDGLPFSP